MSLVGRFLPAGLWRDELLIHTGSQAQAIEVWQGMPPDVVQPLVEKDSSCISGVDVQSHSGNTIGRYCFFRLMHEERGDASPHKNRANVQCDDIAHRFCGFLEAIHDQEAGYVVGG